MRYVLIRGKSNEIVTQLRKTDVSTVSLTIQDPSDNSVLDTINFVVDNPGVTLAETALRGTTDILLSGNIATGKYYLKASDGSFEIVDIQRCSNAVATLANPLRSTYDVSTPLLGLFARGSWTPGENTPDLIIFQWELNGTDIITEDALVVNRKVQIPITGEELFELYPKLREYSTSELPGNQGEIWAQQAWEELYNTFWQQGKVLDNIRSPSVLKAPLLAQISVLLAKQGINITSSYEGGFDAVREAEKQLNREINRLVRSQNVWLDTDDDGIYDAGETLKTNIRLRW